ncbi:hypothetical protein [Pseudomonas syringae]|uniref:hypothetical protein n=1 Tax=Pseudomonas syringae TaxID=317 RepID=UPI001F31BB43|nr:hypothetical protein [Pseudomonas syringae]MCF5224651.1 hypothetical protein [Pseudomonas syringae]MCF5241940.1 hypothetical protein [Pseudomonas syringae]
MTVDIEKLEALAKAASQGNWNQDGFDVQNDDIEDYRVSRCKLLADAKFIAAANPAAVLELIADSKKQAQQFKEWQASHHANYVAAADERDDLRAKLAGLKTGYEAYERVNAELRAECEALRKSLCDVMTEVDGNIRETVRDCVNGRDEVQDIYGYCDSIEAIVGAALSKEQSHD